jgi:hypothetical protein
MWWSALKRRLSSGESLLPPGERGDERASKRNASPSSLIESIRGRGLRRCDATGEEGSERVGEPPTSNVVAGCDIEVYDDL